MTFELFSADQRAEHGRMMAGLHQLKAGRSRDRLLRRLGENEALLLKAHGLLIKDVEADRVITPAGEWLLDNFYIIEEQIWTARRHLPKGYSRELPHLSNTLSVNLPRVYDIALAAIAHGDGRMNAESLGDLVTAYQSVTSLNLGELWAIPIMLRLALIENLRKISDLMIVSRQARLRAAYWADRMILIAGEKQENLILAIADMARSLPELSGSFVAELSHRLRGLGPALSLPLTWIEGRLAETARTIDQLINDDNQSQAANNVSMGNCIGSLRTLDAMNWRNFIEEVSLVEGVLARDPGDVYAKMDFAARDRYRHVVEKLAKNNPRSELEIAAEAIELARLAAAESGPADRRAHVGFYLIDDGLGELKKKIVRRRSPLEAAADLALKFSGPLYFGAILGLSAGLALVLMIKFQRDAFNLRFLMLMSPALFWGSAHLVFALVNGWATWLIKPARLPRMDFSKGLPPGCRALVVVPTMITSAPVVESLARDLEVRFLANRDPQLHFALLTDFRDAGQETRPDDEAILKLAVGKIKELNEKYSNQSGDIFFLFHRPRLWNPKEQVWMGRERKRGKLAALNGFLRGQSGDDFSLVIGEADILSTVKYVITLDTDTGLARDSVRKLVEAMEHPLNRPVYDERLKRIVKGYGILQPRLAAGLSPAERSWYGRLNAAEAGLDPYTKTTSDVYQDIFGEGSFIGKGIYDLAAFEGVLAHRLPDDRILSHDLLEGCYARSGLLTDVNLYEENPTRYDADILRQLRWIRGDWQIAGWIFPKTPGADGQPQPNPLSWLSRWKILDNLRRSLTSPALVAILIGGWSLTSSPWFWTAAVAGLILIPLMISSALSLWPKPADMTLGQHLAAVLGNGPRYLGQGLFSLSCLAYEAVAHLQAITLALWRINISHRRALQWNPSALANLESRADLLSFGRRMLAGPVAALLVAALLIARAPSALPAAGLILGLWLISPVLAWRLSQPLVRDEKPLSSGQILFLRQLAHQTWRFFTTFIGPEDHWLPPDNYQEHPVAKVAHRTSPTNIGLSLLANLAAYDFGAITLSRLCRRTDETLKTLAGLKRRQGHFFNWYDTLTLEPLPPLYISSVDSGNLAGHLMVLRAGLLELGGQPILSDQTLAGLNDLSGLIQSALKAEGRGSRSTALAGLSQTMAAIFSARPATLTESRLVLDKLAALSREILKDLSASPLQADKDSTFWASALDGQCREVLAEFDLLCPWLGDQVEAALLNDWPELNRIMTWRELAELPERLTSDHLKPLTRAEVGAGAREAQKRLAQLEKLALECDRFSRMDYDFLYNPDRRLLTIGYNVEAHRPDAGYYDLLASEARLASFVGIAQGTLPEENWFALGRLQSGLGGDPVLLSWSGSMFEYLMPLLVMPTYDRTLLDETCRAAVARQIEYGRSRSVPWGVSECGYNAFDASLDYQYRAFGVPGLGLKRGLAADLVIAPYASVLALMVAPRESCLNLARMKDEGFLGRFGFYEAADYTPARVPRGQSFDLVRSFMVHHQSMSLLALDAQLLNRPMQRRFKADLSLQATLLLLQEKIPAATAPYAQTSAHLELKAKPLGTPFRILKNPQKSPPQVRLLAGSDYQVMVTSAGGGYSRWRDLSVTRWREDSTRDHWGQFCYLRDEASGEFWSTACQPTLKISKNYEAVFSEGRVEFNDQRRGYETRLEIAVSPEDALELRRLRLTNRSKLTRSVEITSFAETVLAPPLEDALHPAFAKLFVETEALPGGRALLSARRARSENENPPVMLHMMTVHGAEAAEISFETDRLKFIGREGSARAPAALTGKFGPLAGGVGSVLDPIAAIRSLITLAPDQSVLIDMVTGLGETRGAAISLSEKYGDRLIADRVFDLAWTHGQILLRQLNATEAEAHLFNQLASSVIYSQEKLRAPENILARNRRGQSGLWGYAISGDLPIVLVIIGEKANIDLVRQMLQAHEYWRRKSLAVDLVIINEDQSGYRQTLHDQIRDSIAARGDENLIDRPGGVFLRAGDRIAEEDRILIQAVARVIISDDRGSLADQVEGLRVKKNWPPALVASRPPQAEKLPPPPQPRLDLTFWNGLGGFTPDGREYVVTTAPGQITPAPWVNILANPSFGAIVSETGSSSTFSENAHEFRLTPWDNDPVTDSSGEALYLRDEETGQFWSPMPWPCRGTAPYVSRHGFGYSIFEHCENGISSEAQIYVAIDAPVKITAIKVRNTSGRARRLSVSGYVEWVLGDLRFKTSPQVRCEIDPETGALLASNGYNSDFPGRVAFFDLDPPGTSFTCDRLEFIGSGASLASPAAMFRVKLSGRAGTALDPCAALQSVFELAPGAEREFFFKLGSGRSRNEARDLARRFKNKKTLREALDKVWQHWAHTLGAVNVETPDQAFNLLANGWLLYQTLAGRLWARGATYQSGGAFGFRDQLQDVAALIHARPDLVREHLLLCAAHQFSEGDVQHWWHPPTNRGVRTNCSDDYLWLPLITCRYVEATADDGVLDEAVKFIEGRPLRAGENSCYDLPGPGLDGSLYEHCVKAIRNGLKFGAHGLPLMGSGDWNDGLDQVGSQGRGESVWLGFFLFEVLVKFSRLAQERGDENFAAECLAESEKLRLNLNKSGWDGQWYLRAYFDDGSPLGSSGNSEGRIDSLAQSWSVLSGAGARERALQAMDSLDEYLVDRHHALVKLLAPPFDVSEPNPGYIKGYVPGVRENGGQYTHAAIWAGMAFAALGDQSRAWEIFNLINPVNHTSSPRGVEIYKVEPYVMAADVYAAAQHIGRGGWTWYTGSAAWMYRFMMESLLGISLINGRLSLHQLVPPGWDEFKIHYRFRETVYHLTIRPSAPDNDRPDYALDGQKLETSFITLVDDHREHWVEVVTPRHLAGKP
ncbi:MAG: cyclic beta 1-2 glucan synthetase [Candidatus Adiutrix sp.]|nr:cyclic beta 1-2 glucan synthetase [Candidatus Adiutrix sp.]